MNAIENINKEIEIIKLGKKMRAEKYSNWNEKPTTEL